MDFQKDFTAENDDFQPFLSLFLSHGAENAVRTDDLLKLAGLSDVRFLRRLIAAEREHGILILSKKFGGGGYFLPSDDPEQAREELQQFEKQKRAEAISVLRQLASVRAALSVPAGQIALELDGAGS